MANQGSSEVIVIVQQTEAGTPSRSAGCWQRSHWYSEHPTRVDRQPESVEMWVGRGAGWHRLPHVHTAPSLGTAVAAARGMRG